MKKNFGFGLMILGICVVIVACCTAKPLIYLHIAAALFLAIGIALTVFAYIAPKPRLKLSLISEQLKIIADPFFQNFYPAKNDYGSDYGCLWFHWYIAQAESPASINNPSELLFLLTEWFCTDPGTKGTECAASIAYKTIIQNYSIYLPTSLMNQLLTCYEQLQQVWANLKACPMDRWDYPSFKLLADSIGVYYTIFYQFYNDYCSQVDSTLCDDYPAYYDSCGQFCCFFRYHCCSPTHGGCWERMCSDQSQPNCSTTNPNFCGTGNCNCIP